MNEQGTYGTLDLVRIDMCGHFNIKSIGGAKYFITFIDDKSRTIMCIQPLKALQELKEFCQIENRKENKNH